MVSQWKTIGSAIKNQWFHKSKPDVDVYVDEDVNEDVLQIYI